jgi:integrase
MVHMAMMTSMRIGEILALRWGRVDLDRGAIRIDESYYRGHFSSVKSQRSQRQVPLSLSLLLALRDRYENVSPRLDDLVFAARNGRPLRDGNILRRSIYPTCDRLKITRLSWYGLRHLHGILLPQLGSPVAVAQTQLGHSNPRIKLAIYTQVLPGAQRDAVDRLERYLFPSVPKSAQTLCNKELKESKATQ